MGKNITHLGMEAQMNIIDYLRNTIENLMGDLQRSLEDDATESVEEGFTAEEMAEMMATLSEDYIEEWKRLNGLLWKAISGTLDWETSLELYDCSVEEGM